VFNEELATRANASAFGVDLIQPVDIYVQTERAAPARNSALLRMSPAEDTSTASQIPIEQKSFDIAT